MEDPRIEALLAQHGGLITRRLALQVLEVDEVRRLVASKEWLALRRGVYVPRSRWQQLDERVGRPVLEISAASMVLRSPHVVSHDSAALLLGLPTLRQPRPLVHVTRLGSPRATTRDGIKRHQSPILEGYVVQAAGLPVLGLARTAVDIAREHGLVAGVAAIDAARQRGVGLAELWSVAEPMWHWPHVITARRAIERSDGGAESLGESLMRMFVEELGLGPIQTQFEIADGVRRARVDLRVGRHLFEFDGRIKYLRTQRGGVAVKEVEAVVWDEKRRQDWLLGYQLGMSRLVWDDFFGTARVRALDRVAREYALTLARFGSSIDDLAHLVVRRAS